MYHDPYYNNEGKSGGDGSGHGQRFCFGDSMGGGYGDGFRYGVINGNGGRNGGGFAVNHDEEMDGNTSYRFPKNY